MISTACGAESTAHGFAACVGVLADGRLLAMDTRIATVTGRLAGVDPQMLARFERDLTTIHRTWRRGMEDACRDRTGGDSGQRQVCRLDATLAREETLDSLLAEAFGALGAGQAADPYLPREVEIFVPLPGLPRGVPGITVTVPSGIN